jgi:hypothetical protein
VLAGACVLLLPGIAVAAAPPNDDFANAVELSSNTVSISGTTAEATTESGEPNISGAVPSRSVWYRWKPARSGLVRLGCEGGAAVNLGVFLGAGVGALTEVVSDRAGCEGRGPHFRAVAGVDYRIDVDATGSGGPFELEVENPSKRPTNDDFAAAAAVNGLGGPLYVTTEGAGREPGEPWHGGSPFGSSVWFRWTAQRSGVARIYPCEGSFHPAIEAFTGSTVTALSAIGTPADVAAGNTTCTLGGHSGMMLPAIAGQTYSISVDGFGGAWGWADLRLIEPPPPPFPPLARIAQKIKIHGDRANFRFVGNYGDELTFVCKLDGSAWKPCESPKTYHGLLPGEHRFAVIAVHPVAGSSAPAVRHFRIPRQPLERRR